MNNCNRADQQITKDLFPLDTLRHVLVLSYTFESWSRGVSVAVSSLETLETVDRERGTAAVQHLATRAVRAVRTPRSDRADKRANQPQRQSVLSVSTVGCGRWDRSRAIAADERLARLE